MTPLVIEATYENGVLKPVEPLPLNEHEKVRVTIESRAPRDEQVPGRTAPSSVPGNARSPAVSERRASAH